jgi:hypothetical protein
MNHQIDGKRISFPEEGTDKFERLYCLFIKIRTEHQANDTCVVREENSHGLNTKDEDTPENINVNRSKEQKKNETLTRVHLMQSMIVLVDHSGRAVFTCSNAGLVGSNPTQGMDTCARLFCVCVVLCVSIGLWTG